MGLLEFDKLPINTLVGADWDTFRKVTARQQIDKGFKGKYRLTTGVCRLLSALKPIEDSRFKKLADKPLEMDPLFILGHWRSVPDGIPAPDALGAAFLQEEHGFLDAG